ncbi:hypothetical protein ACQCWA_22435 [Rossellomorea aquimaris]
MRGIGGILLKFFLSILGIIFIGGLPVLLSGIGHRELRLQAYWQSIKEIVFCPVSPGGFNICHYRGPKGTRLVSLFMGADHLFVTRVVFCLSSGQLLKYSPHDPHHVVFSKKQRPDQVHLLFVRIGA